MAFLVWNTLIACSVVFLTLTSSALSCLLLPSYNPCWSVLQHGFLKTSVVILRALKGSSMPGANPKTPVFQLNSPNTEDYFASQESSLRPIYNLMWADVVGTVHTTASPRKLPILLQELAHQLLPS